MRWFKPFDLFLLIFVVAVLALAALTYSPSSSQPAGSAGHGNMAAPTGKCIAGNCQGPSPVPTPACDQTKNADCPPADVSSGPGNITSVITTPTVAGDDENVGALAQTKPEDTTSNAGVQQIWWGFVGLADALLVFILIVNGLRVMTGAMGFRYADIVESFPRLILAFIGVHISLVFVAFWIALNNGLCSYVYSAIAAVPVPKMLTADDFFKALLDQAFGGISKHLPGWLQWIFSVPAVPLDLANSCVGLMIWFLSIYLAIQLIVRIGLINLLTVISPLGMITWALPQGAGQSLFRLWINALVATVMVQFLQLICYSGGVVFFGSLSGNVWGVFLPDLIRLAAIWLTLRVPGWLQNVVTSSMSNASQSAAAAVNQAFMAGQQMVGTIIMVATR